MQLDTTVEFWTDPQMPYVETRRACERYLKRLNG